MDFTKARQIAHEALSNLNDAPLSLLVKHARHIINTGGEDCLALGSDFDGVDSLPESISGIESLPKLADEMKTQNISSKIIEKICYKNALQYFKLLLKD